MVAVAAVQLRITGAESPSDRVARVVDLVTGIHPAPAVVVLPELWLVGAFDLTAILAGAEPLGGPWTTAMADLAATCGVLLHAGSFPERHDQGVSNTSVVFSPSGAVVATYRKVHLFGFDSGEAVALTAGRELVSIPSPLGPAGLATCYDLRFPEQFRKLSAGGATTYLLPSSWPAARIPHWDLLTRARALENQAVVVGCNAAGNSAGVPLGGRSVVVGPTGEPLAAAGTDEEVLVVEVDPAAAGRFRADFPVLRDRRFE